MQTLTSEDFIPLNSFLDMSAIYIKLAHSPALAVIIINLNTIMKTEHHYLNDLSLGTLRNISEVHKLKVSELVKLAEELPENFEIKKNDANFSNFLDEIKKENAAKKSR